MNIRKFGRKISASKLLLPFRLRYGLPQQGERQEYISCLRALYQHKQEELLLAHLYASLDALDNKTNSLIQFVAALATIFAGLIALRLVDLHQMIVGKGVSLTVIDATLFLGALCIFVAGISFLLVERVFWPPLGDIAKPTMYGENLLHVRDHRTVQYRVGWLFALFAYVFLLLSLITAVVPYVVGGSI